jgi:hypothetical protein
VYPKYNEYYNNYVRDSNNSTILNEPHKNLSALFFRLKKLVLVKNMDYVINFVDLATKKEYSQLYGLLLGKELKKDLEYDNDFLINGQYLIRDCLFVVQDLKLLLNKLIEDKE